MCGIAGFNWNNEESLIKMTNRIAHRGPDGEGFYIDNSVSLGHRRLAIIDLSTSGKQPMNYKQYWIVYNGEIFNFQEIKRELTTLGHSFISTSDTEIILHAYEEWGNGAVNKFNGEWAFCIYDKLKQELFLSRDRWGVKPLYYFDQNNKFIFASEIKSINEIVDLKTINKDALNQYFYQKYTTEENTIYDDITEFPKACNAIYNLASSELTIEQYYYLEFEILKSNKLPLNERISKITELLPDAIEKRLIADVPVGAFLSGGLDSSYITAQITKKTKDLKTFSIGFQDKSFNETPYSQIVADKIGSDHRIEILELNDELIEEVLSKLDQPFGDPSILPTYLLSKTTKKHVTVSLSGDAGDELFGGYDTYLGFTIAKYIPNFIKPAMRQLVKLIPPSERKVSLEFKMKRFLSSDDKDLNYRHLDWMATFQEVERQKLLGENYISIKNMDLAETCKNLETVQKVDFDTYLPGDILRKVDIASMLNSLEARVPYLDFRIVPLILSLPDRYKIRFFKTKWLLKNLSINILPSKIINRKKRGFSVPISQWLRTSELLKKYLTQSEYYSHNYTNYQYVNSLYVDHLNKKADNSRKLWLVFVFNYWYHKVYSNIQE